MQAVLETDTFSNSAKTIGLTESERHEIATRIGDNPKIGVTPKHACVSKDTVLTATFPGRRV